MNRPNFPAMRAMSLRLTELLAEATETAAAAGGVDKPEEQDLLVGTLLQLPEQLKAATALLDGILTLHVLKGSR